jgi:hypothetical protein
MGAAAAWEAPGSATADYWKASVIHHYQNAFSAMKLIKNYWRNAMTDERLSALTLMYIHPQIDINIDEVIDRFLDKPVKRKLLQ